MELRGYHVPLILSLASDRTLSGNHVLFDDAWVQEDFYSEDNYDKSSLRDFMEGKCMGRRSAVIKQSKLVESIA